MLGVQQLAMSSQSRVCLFMRQATSSALSGQTGPLALPALHPGPVQLILRLATDCQQPSHRSLQPGQVYKSPAKGRRCGRAWIADTRQSQGQDVWSRVARL
ncbi:hypothetical protein MN608_04637 [Microdochium nivale]|nr:hypothetical protein MN608_04637 [Microdochium nivale]